MGHGVSDAWPQRLAADADGRRSLDNNKMPANDATTPRPYMVPELKKIAKCDWLAGVKKKKKKKKKFMPALRPRLTRMNPRTLRCPVRCPLYDPGYYRIMAAPHHILHLHDTTWSYCHFFSFDFCIFAISHEHLTATDAPTRFASRVAFPSACNSSDPGCHFGLPEATENTANPQTERRSCFTSSFSLTRLADRSSHPLLAFGLGSSHPPSPPSPSLDQFSFSPVRHGRHFCDK
ncbi:hypothetical protein IWX46DRAFT_116864 [Phyllosticta citricarpa]|uniref:Uncharacterized protein n=1 Tax=Phyllosticta citricarpa TaxID=55181 RepID=A0ABR1MFC2_9PEZI